MKTPPVASRRTYRGNSRSIERRRHCSASSAFRRIVWSLVLLGAIEAPPSFAEEGSRAQMRSLDEQVQEIKSDVLGIAAELSELEEKLLYPSDTQVSVFVALDEGAALRLDSMRILIDGELAAHHIYSAKELEALRKGGVQRIYTGNLPTGEHQLEVLVTGKRASGEDFSGTESFGIRKDVGPELVGITMAADSSLQLGGW